MYKRRPKTGSLGIVRTKTSSTENVDPNVLNVSQHRKPDKSSLIDTVEADDPDEVSSDPEPSPKKSRRFVNSFSTTTQEMSRINQKPSPSKKSTSIKKLKPTPQNTVDSRPTPSKVVATNIHVMESMKSQVHLTSPRPNGKLLITSKDRRIDRDSKPKTYIEELFGKAGLELSDGRPNSPNVLNTDQAIFIRDVAAEISSDNKEMKRYVELIMKDLEEYFNNDRCLKFAISSTETAGDCDVSRGAIQDSLMRLLLHIDCLQAPVTELLMEKLAKIVMEGSNEENTPVISWVRLILQCFRFLDRMTDGKTVSEQLLDIVLATPDITIQQEVIISLPDIIGDAEHQHTALELSKLVRKSSPQLLASVLEALTNLSLQPEVRIEVQPILMKAIPKLHPEFMPIVLKFLFTNSDIPFMDEMITYLRSELDLGDTDGDTASVQVLVFSTLRDALLASRTLPGVWQKNISSVKVQADHKPIDIIMLLILLSITNDSSKQRSIEGVFRNRIRSEMFTEPLITETLHLYIAVIKEFFQVTTKLAGALLKSTEPAIVDFASKMYRGLFENTDGLWCKWVLTDLQTCVGAGDINVARAALSVLHCLTNNYHHKVKPLGVILMQLLNKLNDLALNEVCQLMDILCHIAYSDNDSSVYDCSIVQDEINILVQKQLASSQLNVLRSGIIGCVMTIKHMTIVSENSSESCDTDKEEETDKVKRAVQLLELLLTSTKNNMEAHGLALDQLSHLLISGNVLSPSFIQKLSSLMRDNLQDAFLVSASDFEAKNDVIQCSLQFNLDEDTEGNIALNLCELVGADCDSSKTKAIMGVSCLHPLLRLLRGLEMGDLSEIDALLGCAISMPVPSVYAEFSQLTTYQQHVALHCLFHCINWLHEIVNCFAYLVKKNEAEKVLMRLRLIVWLRGVLTRCLPLAMDYIPPICHFQSLPKPKLNSSEKPAKKRAKKKGKKKGKKKLDNEESVMGGNGNTSQEPASDEEEEEVMEEKMADLSKYKHYFRELDIDVWLILTQPLNLALTPEKSGQFTPELGPSELLFLLDDYVTKLSHALTSSNKRISFLKTTYIQSVGFENLNKFTPLHVVKNTIKLLPFLLAFLEKTVEYTQNLVKVNDGILDATGMFLEGSAEIKLCQGKLLKILVILFSWVGFQNQVNNAYLLAGLQNLAGRLTKASDIKSKPRKLLVRDCLQYLNSCQEHVLDLTSACTLVDVIKALLHHSDDDANCKSIIESICKAFLCKRWYDLKGNREKGALLNSYINELLSGYLSYSQDQLAAVTSIFAWLITESQQLTEKDGSLTTFPSFTRFNLHILIGGLLKGLEGAIRQKLDDQLTDKEQLELWSAFTQGLETLVTVVKAHDSKPNLRVFMKGCTTVLRLFLTHGMPTCTFMFKHEPVTVSQILKKLQVTTRYIQTICNFVKVSKDTGLNQFLPPIRAVMETIILRVKSIIVINNCTDAFFMGSMKLRDLKGQEIPSQEIQDEQEEVDSLHNATESESEKEEDDDSSHGSDDEETGNSVSILC